MVRRLNFINLGGKKHNKLLLRGHNHVPIAVPRHKVYKDALSSIITATADLVGMTPLQVMQILLT
jgi:hypothetical protein